jgi:hypothetical protein
MKEGIRLGWEKGLCPLLSDFVLVCSCLAYLGVTNSTQGLHLFDLIILPFLCATRKLGHL